MGYTIKVVTNKKNIRNDEYTGPLLNECKFRETNATLFTMRRVPVNRIPVHIFFKTDAINNSIVYGNGAFE